MLKIGLLSLWGLAVAAILLLLPLPAQAGGVVGFGTPGTCTATALHAHLAGGGLVTFNCGPAPVTIVISPTEVISLDTTIQGGGVITLSGGGMTSLFDIEGGNVTLSGLTLRDGLGKAGGAILDNNGRLTVADSRFVNNWSVALGGAIYTAQPLTVTHVDFYSNSVGLEGGAIFASSSLVIRDSTFELNRAASGGTLYALGQTTVSRSTFLTNTARTSVGGALTNIGVATIDDSDFVSNTAPSGGALFNALGLTLTVEASRFVSNSVSISSGAGGAIFNRGSLLVDQTTFTGNRAFGARGGALGQDNVGDSLVINSTFTGNLALAGGGIVTSGTVVISNSTFSANTAFGGGGLLVGTGAPTVTVTNSTFAGNSAAGGNAIGSSGSAPILIKNTLLSGNIGSNCAGPLISLGHNLDDGNTCGLGASGDLTNTNPLLGPLADNGGLTQTQALLPGSPAINHGDNNGCPSTDQRGFLRLDGCDIGAFEFAFRVLLPLVTKP